MSTIKVLDATGLQKEVLVLGEGSPSDPYRHIAMEYNHALVDMGKIFSHSERQTLDNNQKLNHLIIVPAGAHVELLSLEVVTTAAPMYVDIFEGALVSGNGTPLTAGIGALVTSPSCQYRTSAVPVVGFGSSGNRYDTPGNLAPSPRWSVGLMTLSSAPSNA
jgi:hypothetical protein